jgi:hypothetical protein
MLATLVPVLDASLDPYAVIDIRGELLHADQSMRAFLGIRGRKIPEGVTFSALLKITSHPKWIWEMLDSGEAVRLDEASAILREDKLRVNLKATPIRDSSAPAAAKPIGAIIMVRNTTDDVLLVAKYAKMQRIIEEKDRLIAAMHAQMEKLKKRMESLKEAVESITYRVRR